MATKAALEGIPGGLDAESVTQILAEGFACAGARAIHFGYPQEVVVEALGRCAEIVRRHGHDADWCRKLSAGLDDPQGGLN